jgi:hypothetical protein
LLNPGKINENTSQPITFAPDVKNINHYPCLSLQTIAQTDLDPVTVTASLSQSKISESGRDIVVIRGESFRGIFETSANENSFLA